MTLLEFQRLPEKQKITLLYREGIYIGKRRLHPHTALLFQLESFYVEVCYKKYRSRIERINCFASTVPLDPYLEDMDVEQWVYSM